MLVGLALTPATAAAEPICAEEEARLAARTYVAALPLTPPSRLERLLNTHSEALAAEGAGLACLGALARRLRDEGFAILPARYNQRAEETMRRALSRLRLSDAGRAALARLSLDPTSMALEADMLARVITLGAAETLMRSDHLSSRSRAVLFEEREGIRSLCADDPRACRRAQRDLRHYTLMLEERLTSLAVGEPVPIAVEEQGQAAAAESVRRPAQGSAKANGGSRPAAARPSARPKPTPQPELGDRARVDTPRPRPPTISLPPNGGIAPSTDIGGVGQPDNSYGGSSGAGEESPTVVVPRMGDMAGDVEPTAGPEPEPEPDAGTLPRFPWPPPRFSSRTEVDRGFFEGDPDLGAVAETLEAALERAGHVEWSYYSVPAGFALATRLENLEADGSPKSDRWTSTVGLGREFTIAGYLRALFTAPRGYFRIIVLTVTSEPFTPGAEGPSRAEAMGWVVEGGTGLPRSIARIPFGPDHQCIALIYEFEKGTDDAEPVTLLPGRHPGRVHLEKSRVWEGLDP